MEIVIVPLPTINNIFYCRLCAESKNSGELLCLYDQQKTQKHLLYILESLKIDFLDLSDKNLPMTICDICENTLRKIDEFSKKVKEAQLYFRTIFDVKTEIDDGVSYYNSDSEIKHTDVESDKLLMQALKKENHDTKNDSPELENPIQGYIQELSIVDHTDNNLFSPEGGKRLTDIPQLGTYKITSNLDNEPIPSKLTKQKICDKENAKWKSNSINKSWLTYPWHCIHCKAELENMEAVRSHSKEKHSKCYGFKCVDCYSRFNTFKMFIDHVRGHREILRYYCQYCNQKFDSPIQCVTHSTCHCEGAQKPCDMCGEILPDPDALKHHKSIYKKFTYRVKRKPELVAANALSDYGTKQASWSDYGWCCQLCNSSTKDIDTLRNHIQDAHNRCFSIKCMDCTMVMRNFNQFVSHVHKHRPYLKKFCQFCNKNIQNANSLKGHIRKHLSGPQPPCEGCGQIFDNIDLLKQHIKKFDPPRPKHAITAEDLICDVCKKSFTSVCKLREHKKSHDGRRERKFTCESCGKAFLALGALKEHIKTHNTKTQVCKICQKAFFTKNNLKEHVLSHLEQKPYKCDQCERTFTTKLRLKYHLKSHSGFKPHICQDCGKSFRFTNDLKIHTRQHTGIKPHACEICDKTFTNRGNCNKHMIGMHGVSLFKKKKATVEKIDETTKEWMDAIIKEKVKNSQ